MNKIHLASILFLVFAFSTINEAYAKTPDFYGASGVLKEHHLSLVKALTYSLEDEYLSQANYDVYIEEFGAIRPFVQNKVAEKHHINKLLSLFKKYNIDVPTDIAKKFTTKPKTIDKAFSQATKKELDTISMYSKLQSIKVFPEDILTTFSELKMDSYHHLKKLEYKETNSLH
ncbi:hypothetical protein JOC75_002581 [Metabacillus crassostreae]|uniref:hypothetical protein n=1 Tax=Metabacillus crassostreae TaxID=929098 RepID=UPI00195E2E10|nr:hypothetical protein [Metabacillus crassostreae]MBM7604578.1 hypothetical protein [Metabacillus crassostreae]